MAIQLGLGYAPYLLDTLQHVAGNAYPGFKITPTGFLKSALENEPSLMLPEIEKNRLRLSTTSGNIKSIQLAYKPRITPDQTSSSQDCTNNLIPVFNEMSLDVSGYRQFSFYISNDTVARYPDEYAKSMAMGGAPTDLMMANVQEVMHVINGIVGAIDRDLIGKIAFGKNVANGNSGNNTPTTLNFNKNGFTFDFSQGITGLIDQAMQNEMYSEANPLIFVGAGKFNAYQQAVLRAIGQNGAGYNAAALNSAYKWYYDLYWESAFGTDTIGVFQPGAYGFVDLQKYIGFTAFGGKDSLYQTFQITLPVGDPNTEDGTVDLMTFDARLIKITCPTTIANGYGQTVSVQDGWQLIIGKNYGLYQLPTTAVQSTDRLYGNNGSLLYKATNDCVSC